MTYTDLIFDLYGTLVDIHTEENDLVWEKTAHYFRLCGARYTPTSLKIAFMTKLRAHEAQEGQSYECFPDIPFEEVMAELFRDKGADKAEARGITAAKLFRLTSLEYVRLYPGVLDALSALRKKGCRLWILSNAQRVFTEYELRLLGLGEQLDAIYISSDFRCRKPDIRFFNALIEGEGLDRANCLMIGNDRQTDIGGAKNAGLATLYMHTALTPADQAAADPNLLPGKAPEGTRHFEFEGDDWSMLSDLIERI